MLQFEITQFKDHENDLKQLLKIMSCSIAKSSGELLIIHSFYAWTIACKIMSKMPFLNSKEKLLIEIAILIHDINKINFKNQQILQQDKHSPVKHVIREDNIVKEYLLSLQGDLFRQLQDSDFKKITDLIAHHSISKKDIARIDSSNAKFIDIIKLADNLASMQQINYELLNNINERYEGIFKLSTVEVGRYASPSACYLLKEAIQKYLLNNWDVLWLSENSVIFIGDSNVVIPDKTDIINNFTNTLVLETFKNTKISRKFTRYKILGGEASQDPTLFLETKKDDFISYFQENQTAEIIFFRLLLDLYKDSRQIDKIHNNLFIINILSGLSGTSSLKSAVEKAKALYPKELNNAEKIFDILAVLFKKITVKDILPDDVIQTLKLDSNKVLNEFKNIELYEMLLKVSKLWFIENKAKKTDLQDNLKVLLSDSGGQINYRAFAQSIFDRYKKYKISRMPKECLCEHCGFPIAFEATPSSNLIKYSGFTQINPKATSDAPKTICHMCNFDSTYMRKDLRENDQVVYVKIIFKVPELLNFYVDKIEFIIKKLNQSFSNIYTLKEIKETDFKDLSLFLPDDFEIPVYYNNKNDELINNIFVQKIYVQQEQRLLFEIIKIKQKNNSLKDLKAKYLALYAFLNLIGIETHIGFEGQEYFFGENIFRKSNFSWKDFYYKGLVINIIASTIEKKNKYFIASQLIDVNPCEVLTYIANKTDYQINEKLITKTIEFLNKYQNNKDNKGGLSMKEILQDAVFFAKNIPIYFWDYNDNLIWQNNRSKYLITKPVEVFLNAIMQGDDFEMAFAKFINLIRVNIANEKNDNQIADVKDLEKFLEECRNIFIRYYNLKNTNISKFIQTKNGLRNSIFIFKRYKNLQNLSDNKEGGING